MMEVQIVEVTVLADSRLGFSGAQCVKWVTGHVDTGNQKSHKKYAIGRSIKLRQSNKLCTTTTYEELLVLEKTNFRAEAETLPYHNNRTRCVLVYNLISDRIVSIKLCASPTSFHMV